MKYVIDEKGNFTKGPNGHIMVDPENGGQPYEFNVIDTEAAIATLRQEAKEHRQKKVEFKTIVDSIPAEILADIPKAHKALQSFNSMDEKFKIDLAKLGEEKDKAFKPLLEAKDLEINGLKESLFNEKVVSKISTATVLDTTIFNKNRSLAISHYKNRFTFDEKGGIVAKMDDGNVIYSKTNPGKPADVDEALSILISSDPNKDSLMLPSGQRGGGNPPGPGGDQGAGSGGSIGRIKAGLAARTGR